MLTIWDDRDVQDIYVVRDGQPKLLVDHLGVNDLSLMMRFIETDSAVDNFAPAPLAIAACVAGVLAFEDLTDPMPQSNAVGWKKFVWYITGCNIGILWTKSRQEHESAIFGDWITSTASANDWRPDGNVTAIGRTITVTMGIASQAGGGLRRNERTGLLEAGTGDAARAYARRYAEAQGW